MKKLIFSAAAVGICAGLFGLVMTARGQDGGDPKPAQNLPHRIGLIDMREVFQNYKKFQNLREGLKSEIQERDRKVKEMATQAQSLQEKLKSGTYKEGTPEYDNLQDRLIQLKSEYESFKSKAQRDFLRKESEIYKTVYLEAADACRLYAKHYDYTLILRFNRQALQEAEDPKAILQSMNKQVVYHRGEDDITDSVVDYLNRVYDRENGDGTPKAAGGTSGGARRN